MVQREENAETATFYLPPSSSHLAADLIARYAGVPCAAPKRSEVAQFIGPISKLPLDDN
jgi:hypothetical protein